MDRGIYSLIPEARINSLLQTLHSYTGLGVQLIDGYGLALTYFGEGSRYCSALNDHLFSLDKCALIHADAGKKAKSLGEAYVFTCHAELNHIAFPLINRNILLGTVIVGPFLMDSPDSSFVGDLLDKYNISPSLALTLNDRLGEVPIMPPSQVNHLMKLIDHLLSPLLPTELRLLVESQQKAYQQARVNETIQVYKAQSAPQDGSVYYEIASDIIEKMKAVKVEAANDALHRFIAYLHYCEGGRVEQLKLHALSLLSNLALNAVNTGASAELIYRLQKQYSSKIMDEKSTEGPMFWLEEALESFISEIDYSPYSSNSYVRAALRFMANNYNKPLTLQTVADEVGLSPNYLSSLFRKTVGISFSEQLCRIRVEESKRLLLSTTYSLTDIAIAMGFNDQSYYCKVFKRITGLAPGQYRSR